MSGKDERPNTNIDLFIEELKKLAEMSRLLFKEYPYVKTNKGEENGRMEECL